MDTISRAKEESLLPLSQIDQWLKDANILDMENLTTTETGLLFFKIRTRAIPYETFLVFLRDLAKLKNLNLQELREKLLLSKKPVHPDDAKKSKFA